MSDEIQNNVHKIAQYLDKSPSEFTRQDLIKFIKKKMGLLSRSGLAQHFSDSYPLCDSSS